MGIAVHDDNFDAVTLKFDNDLLAEFTATAQQYSSGRRRERRAD
jgi:hypothetical protein